MCVVTAELIAAQSGLGYMIQCRYPNSPADVVRASSSFPSLTRVSDSTRRPGATTHHPDRGIATTNTSCTGAQTSNAYRL